MNNNPVAKRYAKAILEIALENNNLDAIHRELLDFSDILNKEKRVRAFLLAPEIAKPKKIEYLHKLFADKLSLPVLSFLKLLVLKTRISLYSQIIDDFERLVDKQKNRLHATITSAFELEESDLEKIKTILNQVTHSNIILKNIVDEKIIGGLILDVDGTRLDSSMRRKLNTMQESLMLVG